MKGPPKSAGPRPKRDAEHFARKQTKKARFDTRNPSALASGAADPEVNDEELDEEEDAYLGADDLTRRGAAPRRGAVNIDGYESDSSTDAFDTRADAKAKISKPKESKDDDKDMFADEGGAEKESGEDEGEDGPAKESKKKKGVRFADLDRVEDLEENDASKSGGHVSADLHGDGAPQAVPASKARRRGSDSGSSSSDESEVDDAARAAAGRGDDAEELGAGSKKKHAPKLDAFNLRAERQEGAFDESLNFVRAVTDPDAKLDTWMDGVSRRDMRRAAQAQAERDKEERARRRARDEALTSDLLAALVAELLRGETPLEGLRRLAPTEKVKHNAAAARNKNKWAAKKKAKAAGEMEVDGSEAREAKKTPEEAKRERAVAAITDAAAQLLDRGEADIYSTDREMLRRMYKRETGEELEAPAAKDDSLQKSWCFRWKDARDGGETHGPYDEPTIAAWRDAGYFGEGVEFKADDGEWQADLTI